jgi:hypothetical protein
VIISCKFKTFTYFRLLYYLLNRVFEPEVDKHKVIEDVSKLVADREVRGDVGREVATIDVVAAQLLLDRLEHVDGRFDLVLCGNECPLEQRVVDLGGRALVDGEADARRAVAAAHAARVVFARAKRHVGAVEAGGAVAAAHVARIVLARAERHAGAVEARRAVAGAHVAHVVHGAAVRRAEAVETRRVVARAHVAQIVDRRAVRRAGAIATRRRVARANVAHVVHGRAVRHAATVEAGGAVALANVAHIVDGRAVRHAGAIEAGIALTVAHVAQIVDARTVGHAGAIATRRAVAVTHVADIVAGRAVRHLGAIPAGRAVAAAHVARVVHVGTVRHAGAIETRVAVTETHIARVELQTRERNLEIIGLRRQIVLADTGVEKRAGKRLHQHGPRLLVGARERGAAQLAQRRHLAHHPLDVGARRRRHRVDIAHQRIGAADHPLIAGARQRRWPEKTLRNVDGRRVLIVVDAEAVGLIQHVVAGATARARQIGDLTRLRVGGRVGRLTGRHTDDKVERHQKIGQKRRQHIGNVQVKVQYQRDTFTLRQIGQILTTERRKLCRRLALSAIAIGITAHTKAIDTNQQLVFQVIVYTNG